MTTTTATSAKLFVLGRSGAGKTPVALQIATALGVPHVPASEWVRRLFPSSAVSNDVERQAQAEDMARFSIEQLKGDPFACLSFIEAHHDLRAPCVIEGMRNPFDFIHAFDWRHDRVLFLEHTQSPLSPTSFERGLDVIRDYTAWLVGAGLLDGARKIERAFADHAALDAIIAEVGALARPHVRAGDVATGSPSRVHADIEPVRVFVKKELLYGGDPKFQGQLTPCTAFAFSSYPDDAPTFKILLADGAVFSYVPPSALFHVETPRTPALDLADLAYHNCRDGDVVVVRIAGLAGEHLCLFKHKDLWLKASYRFTVDWYRGNDLLHCLFVENGQIAFLPHHKIKFHGREPGFEPYKKMRKQWRV